MPAATESIVYYGLGGGHGHAFRGIATLARWRAAAPCARLLLIAPERARPYAAHFGLELAAPPVTVRERRPLARWVADVIERAQPDRVLVDVFPRGVVGELAAVAVLARLPSVLISRWVEPTFYLEPAVRGAIENRYRALVWAEEPPPELAVLAVPSRRVAPILLLTPAACLERWEARAAFDVAADARLIVVLAAGDAERQDRILGLCRRIVAAASARRPKLVLVSDVLAARRAGWGRVMPLMPAARYLRGADLVVAAAGYHSFHETRSLGVPTIYMPQTRRYDDQWLRAAGAAVADGPAALAAAIHGGVAATAPPPPADGAAELVRSLAGPEPRCGSGRTYS